MTNRAMVSKLSDSLTSVPWRKLLPGMVAFLIGTALANINREQIEMFHLGMLISGLALLTGFSIGTWSG